MKNLLNIKNSLFLLLTFATLSLSSCSNDDYNPADSIIYVSETSNYYGEKPTKDEIRNALVGKWLDDQNNLVMDVKSWKLNPKFGTAAYESEYVFNIDCKVPLYQLGSDYWWSEVAIDKNNVRIGPDFYVMVEGNKAKLFVRGNETKVILMHK